MKGPARSLVVLAFLTGAVAAHAAAAPRFVPTDPHFVVARVQQAVPDAELRDLIAGWRAAPDDAQSVALGAAFLERAHALREPMFVGRAEAVLGEAVARPRASAAAQRLYAETLQYRHDFPAAKARLDHLLHVEPHDAAARLQRASVSLVQGDFPAARGDCAQLVSQPHLRTEAMACLAESLAGAGELPRARALLAAYPLDDADDARARGYFLAVRAELHERAGDLDRAIADYVAGLALAPADDSIRAALADALMARGEPHEACALLDVERAGLALVVRRAACAGDRERGRLRTQAAGWLEQEAARGDAPHLREAAMLALDTGDFAAALVAARANFAGQRQLADVRILARAVAATRDEPARHELEDWLRATGYRDAMAEAILGATGRS